MATETTELDINDRALLQRLKADATAQLACPGLSPTWANAYEQFLAAVDRLDAMWARVEIPERSGVVAG